MCGDTPLTPIGGLLRRERNHEHPVTSHSAASKNNLHRLYHRLGADLVGPLRPPKFSLVLRHRAADDAGGALAGKSPAGQHDGFGGAAPRTGLEYRFSDLDI